jgi:hypothetical protein
MNIYLICASPRSGTTWLHNILLKSNFFKGKIASDTLLVRIKRDELLTDEDPLITRYATKIVFEENKIIKQYYYYLLRKRILIFKKRLETKNGLLLESPYYSFFLPLFKTIFKNNLRIIHIIRDPLNVAFSMSKHPHLKKILLKKYSKSFDLYVGFLQKHTIEDKFAHDYVKEFVMSNYHNLSVIDRALYKWHYFNRAYYLFAKTQHSNVLDIKYEDISDKYLDNLKINNFFDSINIKKIILESYRNLNNNIDPSSILSSEGLKLYQLIIKFTFL